MSGYELVVAASLVDYRGGDVDAARAMVCVFKDRHRELWDACLETVDPRHMGNLILDVVIRTSMKGL